MYYGSGTGGRCCTRQTLSVHSPDGSTFARNDVMPAILIV